MNCSVLGLTRCGVDNIIGFPRNQEDVDWWYTHGVGGAGLQILDIHGCSWSVSDDRGFPGVAVGHDHLVEQDFTYSIPCHSDRARSCWYKVHPSWGLYHFNRKHSRFFFSQFQTAVTNQNHHITYMSWSSWCYFWRLSQHCWMSKGNSCRL